MAWSNVRAAVVEAVNLPVPTIWHILLFVWPFFLASALIVGLGPSLQFYLESVIFSDAPSMYAAANGESISKFPGLSNWIYHSIVSRYLFASIVFALALSFVRTIGQVFIVALIFVLFTLNLIDLLSDVIEGGGISSRVFINLAMNAAGAGAASVLLSFVCALFVFLNKHRIRVVRVKNIAAGIAVVSCSLFVNVSIYAVLYVFFAPVSQRVDLVVAPPMSGDLLAKEQPRESGEGRKAEGASSFPVGRIGGSPGVESLHTPISVSISSRHGGDYEVALAKTDGCLGLGFEDIKKVGAGFPIGVSSNVSIEVNSGTTILSFIENDSYQYRLLTESVGIFSIIKQDDGRVGIIQYVPPGSAFELQGIDSLALHISIPPLEVSSGIVEKLDREVSVKVRQDVDGRTFRFIGRDDAEKYKHGECRKLSESAISIEDQGLVSELATDPGLVISIDPKRDAPTKVVGDLSVKIGGIHGWVRADALSGDSIKGVEARTLDGMSVGGGIESLRRDGVGVEVNRDEHVMIFGEVGVSYLGEGRIAIRGNASALWKGGIRLSQTRWERLPVAMQTFLYGVLLAFVGFAVRQLPWLYAQRNTDLTRGLYAASQVQRKSSRRHPAGFQNDAE